MSTRTPRRERTSCERAYDRPIERTTYAWACATFGLVAGGVAAAFYCGSSRSVGGLIALAFLVGGAGLGFGVYWTLTGRRILRMLAALGLSVFVSVCVLIVAGIANFAHCPLF